LRGALRIGTAEDAIVESLDVDPTLSELVLGVFVAVQAQLGLKGK
jgi:hypothetical protein